MPIVFLRLKFPYFLPQSSFSRFYSFPVPIFTSLSFSPGLRFFTCDSSSHLRFYLRFLLLTCDFTLFQFNFSPLSISSSFYSHSIFMLFIRFFPPSIKFSRFLLPPCPDYFLSSLLPTLAIPLLLNINSLFKPAIFFLRFLLSTCDFFLPIAV